MFDIVNAFSNWTIIIGIDPITGAVEVTQSADSAVGGEKYEYECGGQSQCYVIHSEYIYMYIHVYTCT